MIKCSNCEFKITDKEWNEVYGCKVKMPIQLGKAGKCPYHTKENNEYEFSGGQ